MFKVNRKKRHGMTQQGVATFPVLGHKTLTEIDDVLMKLGITTHSNCGLAACTTADRYTWARNMILTLIKDEVDAARNK